MMAPCAPQETIRLEADYILGCLPSPIVGYNTEDCSAVPLSPHFDRFP